MAVTGQLGGEEIRLDNAATEATLQELVKAVGRMSGQKGAKSSESGKVKELHEKLSTSGDKIEDLGDAAEEAGEDVSEFGSSALNASKAVGGFFFNSLKNLSVGAVTWAADLATSGNRITDIAETIPLVGSYLTPLTKIIDGNIDAFREMSSVGASFGNSIESARLAAANAGLNLDQFQNLVSESSETLAIFGSNTSSGARQFAQLSRSIREGELGSRLMGMGFTIEDVNSGLSSYLELQARQGRLEQMSNRELREGAGEYLEQLDALTKITGMQRKEAEQAMLAQQEESKMRVMRASATNQEAFDANMALLDQLGAAGGAFKDLADGVAQTDIGQKLQAIAPGATELAQQMASGSIGAEEARNRLAQLGPQIEEFAREVGPAALESFGGSMTGLLQLLDENYKLQRLNNDAQEGLTEEEQNRRNKITEALGGFEQTVESIRQRIVAFFIESPVWQSLTSAFEDLIPAAGEDGLGGVLENLNPLMESLAGFIDKFMAQVKENGLIETLKEYVGRAFSGLGEMIKEFLFGTGESEQVTQRQEQLRSQRQDLQSQAATSSGPAQQIAQDKISAIDEELAKIEESKTGVLSGILDPIMNFSFPDALKVGGAAVLGIGALAGAFKLLGAPQVMAGAAVFTGALIGTGAAIQAAGAGISFAGDGVEKVASGLERMSELKDVSKLSQIGTSLGDMGSALGKLATSNALESITSFFGADSPFDKIIKGVNEFSRIDEGAFSAMVLTSNNLKNLAEIDFNSTGIDSYVESIKELTDALGDLNDELSKDNKFGPGTGTNAGDVVEKMDTIGGNGQTGSAEKLDQLNRVMQDILGVLLQSNDMSNRQLRATRGMVGNLY